MQQLKMPQEIEVWYILPAIRRELAKVLVQEQKISQRSVAKLLGVTEAAVSQYLKSKRAKDIKFDSETKQEIRLAATNIAKSKNTTFSVLEEMQRISNLASVKRSMCALHKTMNPELNDCAVCPTIALASIH